MALCHYTSLLQFCRRCQILFPTKASVDEDKVVRAKSWCYTNATVVIRLIPLLFHTQMNVHSGRNARICSSRCCRRARVEILPCASVVTTQLVNSVEGAGSFLDSSKLHGVVLVDQCIFVLYS